MSSECSSIPDAKFFNEKYKYPSWFSRKKLIFHDKMLKRLRKLRYLHARSSQYYDKMGVRLSAPSIFITSLSGIASFFSTSQYIDSDSQNAFGITVGVLASFASIFQAFSASCQYDVKREAHRTVAEQYNALIVKTKFEMEMPNEEDFIDNLEQSILDIQAKCNYFVPQFILDEWSKKEKGDKTTKTKHKYNDNDIAIFSDDDNNDDNNGGDNNVKLKIQEDDLDSSNELTYLLNNQKKQNNNILNDTILEIDNPSINDIKFGNELITKDTDDDVETIDNKTISPV